MDTLVLNRDWAPLSVMPFSALDWRAAINKVYLGHVEPVDYYENWTVRSQTMALRVPSVVLLRRDYVNVHRHVSNRYATVFLRDNYTCQYCGIVLRKPTVDHVTPRSKGGRSTIANLSTACEDCNNRKGDDETIRPRVRPYTPSISELIRNARKRPVRIPHQSWAKYIGWNADLITIIEPIEKPGYSNT